MTEAQSSKQPTAKAPEHPSQAKRADEEQSSGYDFALELPVFQGPLELLLHLIERQELDITEVSLVSVTEQYLQHVRGREDIDLAVLASFVAVGARLLLLKSRALLPRDVDAEDDANDADRDPEALIDALVEYRRYRRAAEHLRTLDEDQRAVYRREAAPPELPTSIGLEGVSTQHLFELFHEVLERLPEEEPRTEVQRETVRIHDRITALVVRLQANRSIAFRELIGAAPSRLIVIVDFLAVLELIRSRYLEAHQEGAFGEIVLSRIDGASPPSSVQIKEDMPGL